MIRRLGAWSAVRLRRRVLKRDTAHRDGLRAGQHSIRINAQWRICFRWTSDGPRDVEIVDYH